MHVAPFIGSRPRAESRSWRPCSARRRTRLIATRASCRTGGTSSTSCAAAARAPARTRRSASARSTRRSGKPSSTWPPTRSVASGYLLYVREGALVAQRFDAARLAVEGEPVVVAPDVLMDERFSRGVFSASDDGVLAYQTGKGSTTSVLRWIDRDGRVLGTVGEPAEYFDGGTPEISPDGTQSGRVHRGPAHGSSDVWMIDLASGTRSRFTAGAGRQVSARPGRRTAGASPTAPIEAAAGVRRRPPGRGRRRRADRRDGSASSTRRPRGFRRTADFSSYEEAKAADGTTCWRCRSTASGAPRPVAVTPAFETLGQVSPNGRYVAYSPTSSADTTFSSRRFPRREGAGRSRRPAGGSCAGRKDGREIFFFAPDNRLMAVEVKIESPSFEVGAIHPLFQSRRMGLNLPVRRVEGRQAVPGQQRPSAGALARSRSSRTGRRNWRGRNETLRRVRSRVRLHPRRILDSRPGRRGRSHRRRRADGRRRLGLSPEADRLGRRTRDG